MPLHMPDFRQDPPAALATVALSRTHDDRDPRHLGNREGALRRVTAANRSSRSDAKFREIDIPEFRGDIYVDIDLRLQTRPDALCGALDFQRSGHDPPQVAQFGPPCREFRIAPCLR